MTLISIFTVCTNELYHDIYYVYMLWIIQEEIEKDTELGKYYIYHELLYRLIRYGIYVDVYFP